MPMSVDALQSAGEWFFEPLGTIDLKSGETLFRQGDACTTVYLLVSGEVQIQIDSFTDEQLDEILQQVQ
jgi:CRP-like cAMP-binding protein